MPLWSPSANPIASKVARATDGAVRVLSHGDTPALQRLLATDPVGNATVEVTVRHRGTAGPGKGRNGALVLGIDSARSHPSAEVPVSEEPRVLDAACWLGSNIIPVTADSAQGELFGVAARTLRRRVSSIYGRAESVLALFEATGWGNHREVRPHQPLMTMTQFSAVDPLLGVRRSRMEEFGAVERACAAMFTEELGFSPYVQGVTQYRDRVRALIRAGHSLIKVDPHSRQIVFKAEFGAVTEQVVQVQGVWVNPAWRGKGVAAPGMAAVVNVGLTLAPIVSLYVNSWNTPAVRTYQRVGFQDDGNYATVLF